RLLEGGGLLDRLLHVVEHLLTALRALAGQVGLPGLVFLVHRRHVHLETISFLIRGRVLRPAGARRRSYTSPLRAGRARPGRLRRAGRSGPGACASALPPPPPAAPGSPGPPRSRGCPGPAPRPGPAWP